MVNIYDTANQLEREIRELPEYKAFKEEHGKLKEEASALALYEEFRGVQMDLQQKMMSGSMPSEDDQKKMQEVGEKVQKNDLLNGFLLAEQKFGQLMDDVNRIVFKPIQEIYGEK